MKLSRQNAGAILVVTTMIASAGWIFSKQAIQGLPPFGFIGIRFLLGSLCLGLFCFRQILAASWRDILSSALVGVFLGAALNCWVHAISMSNALGEGAFIVSLSMLLTPLVGWGLFKRPPSLTFWFSMPIAVAGLALLSAGGSWGASSNQLWFILAALFLALHFNFNSLFSQRLPVLPLACIQLFITGVVGIGLSLSLEPFPSTVTSDVWGWLILSATVATALRYFLQTTGQKYTTTAKAALIMLLEPVWTVVLSVILYSEPMPVSKVFGCGLIMMSLIIYLIGSHTRRSQPVHN